MRRANLGIGGRLGLAFGATAVLLAILALVSVRMLGRIHVQTHWYTERAAPRFDAADRLEAEVLYLAVDLRVYMIWPDDARRAAVGARRERVRAALEAVQSLPRDPDGARMFAPIPALTEGYLANVEALADGVSSGTAGRGTQEDLARAREALLSSLREFRALERDKATAAIARIEAAQATTRRVLLAVAAAVLLILVVTALLTWRAIHHPALALVETTRRVAAGEWEAGVALAGPPGEVAPLRDEIAELSRAFGRMAVELRSREERLAVQNEELQAQNEEIRVQSEEIRSQSEELHSQSEELQMQNEELMAHGDELRRMNEALARSERRYRQLFEHVSEGFALHEMVYGPDGAAVDYRFLDANPAFERITGLSRERIVSRTVREVLPGIEPEWIARYARVVETGEPVRFESAAATLGKHFEVIAFRAAPGQFGAIFFDVTDRKRAAAALVEADRRKDEFLAVLSHELRNPLAPIRNALQLLEAGDDDPDRGRRAREVIARQMTYLTRLVEDLLDTTRISRGKIQLQRAHVDLAAIVSQSAEDNASVLDAAGVRFELEVPGGSVWVNADPARLSQVVGNLLQNAAKFTPAGGRVVLSLGERDGRACIRVRDTGIGIDPDVLVRVFEPFVQAEQSLARTRGGLGLGLALVKGLVELHGGTVRAESGGADRGAEFTLELPLAASAPPEPCARARGCENRRRVLLVEDNVDGAETLRDVLALAGHDVEIALDGTTGVARARELVPDAVLCDLGLPDIDGYEVARRIRADPELRETLLVALTGYALPDDQRRAADAGFDAHLAKPATLEAIEALLARAAPRRSSAWA